MKYFDRGRFRLRVRETLIPRFAIVDSSFIITVLRFW
jgi:hypothetical protein